MKTGWEDGEIAAGEGHSACVKVITASRQEKQCTTEIPRIPGIPGKERERKLLPIV